MDEALGVGLGRPGKKSKWSHSHSSSTLLS
jgi:hypothetical protein